MGKETANHVETIKRLILTIHASDRMHALLVLGKSGWGKSTSVDAALSLAGVEGVHLGSYNTPLNLYNFLHGNSGRFVVIDDSSGLYNEPSSMALLKSATWAQGKPRILKWGSTTGKATVEQFEFKGKIIIVCNSFPNSSDAEAIRSRSYPCEIDINLDRAKELLASAAANPRWYSDTAMAIEVSNFLCERLCETNLSQVSYRMLEKGYELAKHNPNDWQDLLGGMVSAGPEDPKKLVKMLSRKKLSVRDQIHEFEKITGFKRRTFFKYRRELNISER